MAYLRRSKRQKTGRSNIGDTDQVHQDEIQGTNVTNQHHGDQEKALNKRWRKNSCKVPEQGPAGNRKFFEEIKQLRVHNGKVLEEIKRLGGRTDKILNEIKQGHENNREILNEIKQGHMDNRKVLAILEQKSSKYERKCSARGDEIL